MLYWHYNHFLFIYAGNFDMFRYNINNYMDGLYIAPAFMDKLVIHITKNFLNLPNIKVILY